ncbi:carbohydrate esterase family 9 protein [Mycena filopes]|nr:carbohydrate esterase family 9 protein [Mycena filopes]
MKKAIKGFEDMTHSGNDTDILHGDLYLDKGIVKAIGSLSHLELANILNLTVMNAHGAWLTAGLVDLHTHMGLMSASDFNSKNGPILPWLRNIDGFNTHDEAFQLAIAGGVTSVQVLAGSKNNIGQHRQAVVKLVEPRKVQASSMLVEPNTTTSDSTLALSSPAAKLLRSMGIGPDAIWALRSALRTGLWATLGPFPEPLRLEMLVDVLRGKVKVTSQCQSAVDIDSLVRLTNEFEFSVASIQHGSEAWLVPELLNRTWGGPPAVALLATNYRYNLGSYRGSEFAPAYLLQEAAIAHHYGLPPHLALASVTSVPAAALGLDHRIGSLHEGADADVVMWDSNPLQMGATPSRVWIDGQLLIPLPPRSDRAGPVLVGVGKEGEEWSKFPSVPNWDAERKEAIGFEGLPPLTPRNNGKVVFQNVREVWGGRLQQMHGSDSGLVDVVVEGGKIVCIGACPADAVDTDTSVDLNGGVIVLGMMTFGSPLGLEEIRSEPSTGDGAPFDAFREKVPGIFNDPGQFIFEGGDPDVIAGVSTTFSTGASHAMERGAIVQAFTALHVAIHRTHPFSKDRQVSVSSQIAGLRRLLFRWEDPATETGKWFKRAAEGVVPLVIDVGSADIMATLLILKAEVENRLGSRMRMVFSGAAEAHILAKEIRNANVAVILDAKPTVGTWEDRRSLPGPPLSNDTTLGALIREGVKVGLKCQEAQDAQRLRFDLTWAMLASNGLIGKTEAYALVSTNLQDILGVTMDTGDLVAYAGGSVYDTSSRVAAVISGERGEVDVFVVD